MGAPPKYIIDRKLIRIITKKVIPQTPLIPQEYTNGLMNCWKQHGIGSTRCVDEELKYDFAQKQTEGFKDKIQKMGVKQAVMEEVKRPTYHFEEKGRHRKYHNQQKALINVMKLL